MDNAFIASALNWDHRTPKDWQRLVNKVFRKLHVGVQLSPTPGDMANVEARMNLFFMLEQVLAYKVPGDIVDVGCNAGDSTVVMQMVVSSMDPTRRVEAYDSFEGLPELKENDKKDGIYQKGYMNASLETFEGKFRQLGLKMPGIHRGWFEETIPSQLPDQIAFALIDGDLYESTKHVLPHIYERMAPGAIGLVAVYYDEKRFPRKGLSGGYKSPGVKRALDEFFADKPEEMSVLYSNEYSNGYFRKM